MKFILKVIPWIPWLAAVWYYFATAISAFAFLLTGQLNDAKALWVTGKFLALAVGLTVVAVVVQSVCRRYRRSLSED